MPDGFHGYGTTLGVGDGASPEVFATVAAVTRIKVPGFESSSIDVTNLASTGAIRRMIAGMITLGKVPFSGFYLPANATQSNTGSGLIALGLARTIKNFKITLSDADDTEWVFEGWVSKFDPGEAGLDAAVPFDAETTLTGDTYTAP